MAILITGGAGFIGLEVVRLLIEHGEKRPVIFSRNPDRDHLGDLADQVETGLTLGLHIYEKNTRRGCEISSIYDYRA